MKKELVMSQFTSLIKVASQSFFTILLILFLLTGNYSVSAQNETLATGAYIINMGIVPQTQSNALKPYGLVYDLLKNYNVPIKWVISQTKVKDGADFTYNGVEYKGGTFIIPAEARNATVNSRITFFGVTGTTTTSPLTVNVTYTLKHAPSWTLDTQNGNIAAGFFTRAGIPASAYGGSSGSKTPAQLNSCDDIYVMPHADADWSYYGPLRNWVMNNNGSFWGGCRTGSQIENLFNPSNPAEQMNFLSNNVGAAGNALVPHGSHNDGTPPYTHQFPSSPASQYMGITDGAHQNGSEQIYLPKLNGSWRPTTQVIATDPTHSNVPTLSPGPTAAIVFGRAYGNSNYGWVMYEGGHDIGGTSVAQIAAQRAFWNFSFVSSFNRLPVISALNLSGIVISGKPYVASVSATSGSGAALSYLWSSSCGGSFSSPTGQTTNFTPPAVTVQTACTITVTVTDACGNAASMSKIIQVFPPEMYPDFNVTYVNESVLGNVKSNDVVPSGTTYGTAPTLISSPSGSSPSISMNANGSYSFISNVKGVYRYLVPVCIPGQATPCPSTLLTITVLCRICSDNNPVANTDIASTKMNTPVILRTLSNDRAGNPGGSLNPASVTVTIAALNGTSSINPATGDNTYTPNTGYVGMDTLTYTVCDNQSPAKCATAIQIIRIWPATIENTTLAADDYAYTPINTAVSGNAITNDTDPEGNTQTITAQTTTIAGKGTLVLNTNGTFTFTPVTGFTGPVSFPYTTTDNGSPVATANATIYILVSPVLPTMYPDYNVTYVNVSVPGNVNTNDVVPTGTTYGTSPTLISSPSASIATITMGSNGTYSFVADKVGVYVYKVPVCVPGQAAPCPTTLLTITVLGPTITSNPPVANTDIATTKMNTPVILRTLSNDRAGNPGGSLNPASVTVTVAALHGTTSVDASTGDNTYTPATGYVGMDTLTYSVCDNSTPTALCATALQIIKIEATTAPNTTLAADDYAYTPINTAVSGNAITNDTDPEGNTQTITAQTTTIAGKGTLVLGTNGAYTFIPVTGFTGPVSFPYTTTDNGSPVATANATIYILVSPVVTVPDLTPRITANPNNIIGPSSSEITIQINELLNTATNGTTITLYVDKLNFFSNFSFNNSQTSNLAGQSVQNSLFTIDAVSNPDFYILTTNAVFSNSLRRVAFTVTVNPGQTKGSTPINVFLLNGSGGETNFNNNSDYTILTFSF